VHERRAVSEQIAQPRRSDASLGEQPGAQQMREPGRVDRVGLHPGSGYRPGPERVREMHVKAGVLEQFRESLPAVGRLQRDVRDVGVAEQLADRLASGRDPLRERQLAVLADDRDLRAAAVQSMPTHRVGLDVADPPLDLSGRAAVIRAVFNVSLRDGGPT
jgi:hypothetical protein